MKTWRKFLLSAVWVTLPACGPEFDPASEVKSLRSLAVLKDKPYAAINDTVKLDLVWHDGKPGEGTAPRKVNVTWYLGCINPLGDVYYGCFAQMARDIQEGNLEHIRSGSSVEFPFSAEAVAENPRTHVGDFPYDLAIPFFTLCAGEIGFDVAPSEETPFPLVCRSPERELLGPDDFVIGYTAIYAFGRGVSNQPPPMSQQFELNGQLIAADCVGAACAGDVQVPEIDCDNPAQSARCVPVCEDDGDDSCSDHPIKPVLPPGGNAELDAVSTARRGGRDVQEQMWINYYVDRGGVSSDVRLLNDVKTGWNPKYETKFHAPKERGPVKLWAVIHDSRGGTNVARVTIQAR